MIDVYAKAFASQQAYVGREQRLVGASTPEASEAKPTALIGMLKTLCELHSRLDSVNGRLAGVVERAIGPQPAQTSGERDAPKASGLLYDMGAQLDRLEEGLRAAASYIDHIERLV